MEESKEAEPTTPETTESTPTPSTEWHRMVGVVIVHLLENTPFKVETEVDVALTPKKIDIVITTPTVPTVPPPLIAVGIEELREKNLFTFKSHQESLNIDTLQELVSYYTDYRKTFAPKKKKRLKAETLRLFAISTRRPETIIDNPDIPQKWITNGVYDLQFASIVIRLIVIHELEEREENANLFLFSNNKKQVQYGQKHHNLTNTKYETLIDFLLNRYKEEGDQDMVDLLNPTEDEVLAKLVKTERTSKKILSHYSPKDRLEGLSKEDLLEIARLATEKALEADTDTQPPQAN